MSGEKNPEVVGCDASIMKNVWEIRVREFNQKMLLEQERLEKSALPSINKDWANRMTAKTSGYKRVERKVAPADTQTDRDFWKSKQPLIPPTGPQGRGPLGRPGIQAKGLSTPASTVEEKKRQDKSFNRLQLLIFISKTQPSSVVWGKAWRYNKSSQSPAEGSTSSSDWGQSWMFTTHQPPSEEGQTWLNEANQEDPLNLHLWRKPEHRMVESQEQDLSPSEEWQMSWKRFDQMKKNEGVNGENVFKLGFFRSLVESQHHNETLCSSEWVDSWQTTKTAHQQDPCTAPNEDLMNFSSAKNQNERDISSDCEECWRLVNHHGGTGINKPPSPDWVNSWRAAVTVFNNRESSDPSQTEDHSCGSDDRGSHLTECHRHIRSLFLQLCNTPEAEWTKAWQTMKNNSKPCEELEKVLQALPPQKDVCSEPQSVEKSSPERADPRWEQLKHDVVYRTRRGLTVQKLLPPPEWRDSWKMMKLERRRHRADPQKPFRASGEDVKRRTSDWKDSWKFITQPLNQKPDLWQQGRSSSTQIHGNWERHQNNFSLEEFPKNGPTMERIWGESWKFSRHHHRSEPEQNMEQIGKEKSNVPPRHPDYSREHESPPRSTSDWEDAWMFSESWHHHDKPSFSQWRESWKWFTPNWTEQVPVDKWVNESMEIQNIKELVFLQGEEQMFRDRSPEKGWSSSWSAGTLLNLQPSYSHSSGRFQQIKSNATRQQQAFTSEYGSKWGMSFRLANPMPHLEQPWLESCPNPAPQSVLWSRGNKMGNEIKSKLNNHIVFWEDSHQFLQKASKRQSKESNDPRVILTKKIQTRKHLSSSMEKGNQSERKWAGGHLLGKTQPRPKRGAGSANDKLKVRDNSQEKFFEDWMESWRSLVQPGSLRKQMRLKLLSGWDESWKFLLPPY